jgi:Cyclic nucleotide-binding domain/FHA domain
MSQDSFVEMSAGKTLFGEGETGTSMYVIESGLIEIQRKGRSAATATLLGPGDVCGAEFLIEGKPHTATATIKETARLLRLSRADLIEVIRENPEIAIGLLRRLLESERSREAVAGDAAAEPVRPTAPAKAKPAAPSAEPAKLAAPPPPAGAPEANKPAAVAPAAVGAAESPAQKIAPSSSGKFGLRIVTNGQVLPLEAGRSDFLVGRPDPASGMLPEIDLGPFDVNRSLSRRHARIVHHDGVYFVREDNATVNGTYANNERLTTGVEVPLKLGDKLRFGTIEVELIAL